MPYAPQTWHDLPATDTPESAARFGTMETGIQLGASNVVVVTATKTSAYTAVAGDLVIVDASGGAVTITLPAVAANVTVAVRKADSSLNAVTVAAAGSDTIGVLNPTASVTLSLPSQTETYVGGPSTSWVTSSGRMSVSSLDNRYSKADPFPLTTGEANVSRINLSTVNATTTQTLTLSYFTASKTESIANVKTIASTAGATLTLCRLGIYSEAGNGDLTLVASIANDTTLWVSNSTAYSRAFSVAWSKTAGQRYALGMLVVGTTLPLMYGLAFTNAAIAGTIMSTAPRIYGQVASQSDLPSTITAATVANAAPRYIYAEFS